MLTDVQLQKYADVLIWGLTTARTKKFKKQDLILIRYDSAAVRLAEVVYKRLIEMGFNTAHRVNLTPAMEKSFFEHADDHQLVFQTPGDKELYSHLNGSIFLHAPDSITHLSEVDPEKIGKSVIARKYLREILDHREEQGDFGWTLCLYPTRELADHAGLSLDEYTRQVVNACFLDSEFPVDEWNAVYQQATDIKKWLNSMAISTLHVESGHTDLTIRLGEKRKWIGISGHNIPSFEIFTSPDWRGTRGVYFANQPSYRSGNYVEDVRLEFKQGSAVRVEARTGEEFVKKQLEMDAGAKKIGEFSLTDTRFSKINAFMANTLYDENYGGTFGNCHIAVGASYSDTYDGDPKNLNPELKKELGFNDSALHWDLVNTENKKVTAHLATGEHVTIYENGMFTH